MKFITLTVAALLIAIASNADAQVCGGNYYQPYPTMAPAVSYAQPALPAGYAGSTPYGYRPSQPNYYGQPAYGATAYYAPVAHRSTPVVSNYWPTQAYRPALPPSSPVIGRGIIGQPKAYVPGQPLRNFIRYLTP